MNLLVANYDYGLKANSGETKSKDQIIEMLKNGPVTNCSITEPFKCENLSIGKMEFNGVEFLEDFSLTSLADNNSIIFEDCVFHKSAVLLNINNSKIIFTKCKFKDHFEMFKSKTETIELSRNSHYSDANLSSVKANELSVLFVQMKKNSTMKLKDSTFKMISYY